MLCLIAGCSYWRNAPESGSGVPLTWSPTLSSPSPTTSAVRSPAREPESAASVEERLRLLKTLRDEGLISDDDWETRRREILMEL